MRTVSTILLESRTAHSGRRPRIFLFSALHASFCIRLCGKASSVLDCAEQLATYSHYHRKVGTFCCTVACRLQSLLEDYIVGGDRIKRRGREIYSRGTPLLTQYTSFAKEREKNPGFSPYHCAKLLQMHREADSHFAFFTLKHFGMSYQHNLMSVILQIV